MKAHLSVRRCLYIICGYPSCARAGCFVRVWFRVSKFKFSKFLLIIRCCCHLPRRILPYFIIIARWAESHTSSLTLTTANGFLPLLLTWLGVPRWHDEQYYCTRLRESWASIPAHLSPPLHSNLLCKKVPKPLCLILLIRVHLRVARLWLWYRLEVWLVRQVQIATNLGSITL